jgi:pimeloyl-ACP methyl ester carboxylesterase
MPEPSPIPYLDFGGNGPLLHFAHANGYPPLAYRPLLENLARSYHVLAMKMRPLWADANYADLQDWRPFASDLVQFLRERSPGSWIGVGHSVGGNATLRAALHHPDLFRAVVLIDPVIFPPWASPPWKLLTALGLDYRLHPLARRTLRRRRIFESQAEMFANYRSKAVFNRMDDQALQAYVESMARETPEGKVELVFSPEWEARIYVTAIQADLEIWRELSTLKPPLWILRGAETDTFLEQTARRFQRALPSAVLQTIPEAGHLLPLEMPEVVGQAIREGLEKIYQRQNNGLMATSAA